MSIDQQVSLTIINSGITAQVIVEVIFMPSTRIYEIKPSSSSSSGTPAFPYLYDMEKTLPF